MRIRVGIYDKDETYVSRMVRYFTTYYIDKIELSVFSEADNFYDFVKYKKIDVALVSSVADYRDFTLPKNTILAYLSEESNVDKIDNVRAVYKYQKMENLYREILGIFAELDNNAAYKVADGESPIILFNGAAGGVGTTTMAIACARHLTDNGKKVLYLNLEDNGVVSPVLTGEGNATLSEVLYSVKSSAANLVLKLESMVRKDEYGVYFYEPYSLTLDSAEMTEKNLEEILKAVKIYFGYHAIVIDVDSGSTWKSRFLRKWANKIVIVSDGREYTNIKLDRLLKEIEILDEQEETRVLSKVNILGNRYTNKSKNVPEQYRDFVCETIKMFENDDPKAVVARVSRENFLELL